jgi:hypothetical protein
MMNKDIPFKRLKDKLVLVGAGEYGETIPYQDSEYEKWILGGKLHKLYKRPDLIRPLANVRGFEIHTMETRPKNYLEFLQEVDHEIIMQEEFDFIKRPLKYPLEDILEKYESRYYLCTFSYMIALAMYMEYKEVYIYGANMLINDDYVQKYNFEYWLGRAQQAGIKIYTTENCDLLKCGALYGYEAVNTLGVYQAKYMGELSKNVNYRLKVAQAYLENAINSIDILDNERNKFMQEILDRHKINAPIVDYDTWAEEDC